MKKTALAFAALVALSGTAFAGETVKTKQVPATACIETSTKAKVDCNATGSVTATHSAVNTASGENASKLGIDVNPWIMPNSF